MLKQLSDKILTKIQQFDANPYTIQLNYKNKQDFKSRTGGCISLLFYLSCLAILIINSYYFFTQQTYIYQQYNLKNDLTPTPLNHSYLGLLVTATEVNGTGQGVNLTSASMFERYGLQAVAEEVDQVINPVPREMPLVAGASIGEFDFREFMTVPVGMDFYVSGSSSVVSEEPYHRVALIIRKISNISSNYDFKVKFVFINHAIDPKLVQQNFSFKIRQFYVRNYMPLSQNEFTEMSFYFKKLWLTTDQSLFFTPSYKYKNQTFYDEQLTESMITTESDQIDMLVKIQLKRSLYTVHYTRYYKKLTTFLAESMGLIGLISLVFILYRGYNKWAFTENQLVQPSQRSSTNILKYYYQMIRNLKNYTTSSQKYDQFEHNLDIYKILLTLQDFQVRLRKLEGKSDLVFSSHHEPQYSKINGNLGMGGGGNGSNGGFIAMGRSQNQRSSSNLNQIKSKSKSRNKRKTKVDMFIDQQEEV